MNIHKNARTTPQSRAMLIHSELPNACCRQLICRCPRSSRRLPRSTGSRTGEASAPERRRWGSATSHRDSARRSRRLRLAPEVAEAAFPGVAAEAAEAAEAAPGRAVSPEDTLRRLRAAGTL